MTPIGRKGMAPTPWTLGQLYRGASRYEEDELVAAIAGCGELETAQRGALGLEALTAWIVSTIGARA